jgi:hypothetical protein
MPNNALPLTAYLLQPYLLPKYHANLNRRLEPRTTRFDALQANCHMRRFDDQLLEQPFAYHEYQISVAKPSTTTRNRKKDEIFAVHRTIGVCERDLIIMISLL